MPKTYKVEERIKSRSHKRNYREYVLGVYSLMGINPERVAIYDGRGRRRACGWFDKRKRIYCLKLPRWSRTEIYMLHEIAHTLEGGAYGKYGHGKPFQEIFVGLLGWFLPAKAELYVKRMKPHRKRRNGG